MRINVSLTAALLVLALFGFLFVLFHSSLSLGWNRLARRSKLRARHRPSAAGGGASAPRRYGKLGSHLADLLAASGWRLTPERFAGLSLALGVSGAAGGLALFQSARSALLLASMLLFLPYGVLRFRLINRQMAARLDFLPALELFYQSYLVTGRRHVRTALRKTVEERRLPGQIQAVFEQLYRNLSVHGGDEISLRRFALAVGHVWADYFANMIGIALAEGNDISDNLKELIADMRKSRMDDQAERHRLLEIRLANFSPVLFLALFLIVNFRMNAETSYRYYVLDAGGRGMLLNAVALIFVSFLMGVYLSRRKL